MIQKFYGKYRGTVIQNVDPMQIGRIQVIVPDVSGLLPSSWAMPCFPLAGKQMGAYWIPQIGAGVWVLTFLVTRYVSLGSVLAAVAVPLASWLRGNPLPLNLVATALGLFVIIRHRENLRRLLNGTEHKFAKKPPESEE